LYLLREVRSSKQWISLAALVSNGAFIGLTVFGKLFMHLGDPAPDFTAWASSNEHVPLHFHRWKHGKWCLFFSHPGDFTPVCTTELVEALVMRHAFEEKGCLLLALSIDSMESHARWFKDLQELAKEKEGKYFSKEELPIVADEDRAIAKLYGMLDSPMHDRLNTDKEGLPLSVRTVFFIDPANRIRATLSYPAAVGRDFDELMRVLIALQTVDAHPVATPANWRPGQDVLVRVDHLEDRAQERRVVKPYLQYSKL